MNKEFPTAVWSAQYGYIEEQQVIRYLRPVKPKLCKLVKSLAHENEKRKVEGLMTSLFNNKLETLDDYVRLVELVRQNDLNEIYTTSGYAQKQLINSIQSYLCIASRYAEGCIPQNYKLTKKQLLRGNNWQDNSDIFQEEHRTKGEDGRFYINEGIKI